MYRIGKIIVAVGITAALGIMTVTGGQAVGNRAGIITVDPHTFDRLSVLGSYHVESSYVVTTGKKTQSAQFSEDVHGKDYHLTIIASSSGNKRAEFYNIGGHFYVAEAGQFVDLGAMGKTLAQPMLAMSMGFWSALFVQGRNAHYVGRVMTSGRRADRYTEVFSYAPSGTVQNVYFTDTVDIDVATHAPLRVIGNYRGKGANGIVSALKTNFLVTRIGQVGAIHTP